ncbi:MAG: hypothetical protein A2Z96_06720 [Spirochaetes bacterium GWB1_48_6]|nr:MAG: hypothetical protein A2Z96_06720 [Spirochaetes bacterium GWB1_48_6]
MVVTVEKLISGGEGMGRIEGKPVFIPGVLPGEKVEIQITEEKPGFSRGVLVNILEASPHRVAPPCPLTGTCGGCSWQHLDGDYQRQQKALLVQEGFKRLGAQVIPLPQVIFGDLWHYRHRIQVHRDAEGVTGFKAAASHKVVQVEFCPVLSPPLNGFLKSLPQSPGTSHRFLAFTDGKEVWAQGRDEEVSLRLLNKTIHFSLEGFFQSNLELLPPLVNRVLELCGTGESVLDLYGGVGTFGTFLSDNFTQVTVVEENKQALALARKNVPRGQFFLGTVEEWIKTRMPRPQVVLVDPPRTGLSTSVRKALIKMRPSKIVYVSCNPDTMARDSKDFAAGGYHLKTLEIFDFYPQTPHIEALGLWTLG